MERLENRVQAGKLLAEKFSNFELYNPIVLALPRGGVPVAAEISSVLQCPLDVVGIKKIGAPQNPEFAIGAVGEDGTVILNQNTVRSLNVDSSYIKKTAALKSKDLKEQLRRFRGNTNRQSMNGRDIIVVDDGLATGATMTVALRMLRKQNPRKIFVALPVAAPDSVAQIKELADEVFCLMTPKNFTSVGIWYEEFDQVSDEEVIAKLKESRSNTEFIRELELTIDGDNISLPGNLNLVPNGKGLIIFAHGSGSSRNSPRNQYVATELNKVGFSTLLFDLLSDEESKNRANVFNIPLLAQRLLLAVRTMKALPETEKLSIGFFGASTGAGAALHAAAEIPDKLFAVVSRGGRPDLADDMLKFVKAPCLLIVGGNDEPTLSLNKKALTSLQSAELVIVPGATHLFEEEGALTEVVEEASSWFQKHLTSSSRITPEEMIVTELKNKAVPFHGIGSLDEVIEKISTSRIVMLGEATHGTHEFYALRRMISERLIQDHGFNFIAVEGDWPDFQRLNKFINGSTSSDADSELKKFSRWPTWMWANSEVTKLLEFLKEEQIPIYGLDVYSLFESIDAVKSYAQEKDLDLGLTVEIAYSCFDVFHQNEKDYARHLTQFPEGCRKEVLSILRKLLRLRIDEIHNSKSELSDAQQNARIVAHAEDYYRKMLFGGPDSWNVRDLHMAETLATLLKNHGPESKCIVWAHNSHIGDYHATDMAGQGYVNLGGIAREQFGIQEVSLVGFGTYQGKVIASHSWEGKETEMNLPPAPASTFEDYCHKTCSDLKSSGFSIVFEANEREGHLGKRQYGHRAVGVVYDPRHENRRLNYVPTIPAQRYDAFVFVDESTAVHPLKTRTSALDLPETWPGGV
ncbi:erythromycin esterase [Bdellovibrio sp. ZAP7]|uniref:erythromycin esterase family protein n=1 Tax=Bdellovibrio sp. ZAP7 TaxID=2231053 RepID=UPI00115A4B56|nr:erythromycin esterase family protein [Bdellovibrio sp. ZAP7]QDK44583.1 erythromycin esterase [Bdellovibrio sp. ZAP7]